MIKSRPSYRALRLILPTVAAALTASHPLLAQEAAKPAAPAATAPASPEAEKAWQALAAQNARPVPPASWSQSNPPKQDEFEKWRPVEAERLVKVADQAGEFLKQYPQHEKAELARKKQGQALEAAARLGNEDAGKRLAQIEEERLRTGNVSEDEKFQLKARQVQRQAQAAGNQEAAMKAFTEGARGLIKEFPTRGEPYEMLAQVAENLPPEEARAILEEVAKSPASAQAKERAQAVLKRMDAVGKPLDLKFTAVDGREVDVQAMKGKVVLVDFWATWCGPCVAELPNVKAAYDKLNPKGFEIVGLSFDQEKGKLESFVKEKQVAWPQYFDGKGWQNKFGQEFGITSIPAMWLVDKKGNLRDMNARDGLADKVEKLLAE